MNSMLKKLRLKKEKKESEARQKLKKELFAYSRGINFGFLNKATCMHYDHILNLLAVANKTGALHIYGSPGVELYAQHSSLVCVRQVCFLQGQAVLLTLCEDNSVNVWQADVRVLQPCLILMHSYLPLDVKLDEISSFQPSFDSSYLLLTLFKTRSLLQLHITPSQATTTQSRVTTIATILQRVPGADEETVGAVVAFLKQPSPNHIFLIGYACGLMVLWDDALQSTIRHFTSNLPMTAVGFSADGQEFASCHEDGSYVVWSVASATKPKEPSTCPYGPFPCKPIHSIKWHSQPGGDTYVFFSGGMPKAGCHDNNTLTVMNYTWHHVVYQLTSRVIDFVVVCKGDARQCSSRDDDDDVTDDAAASADATFALLILAEEEFVAIDLLCPDWKPFHLPYLNPIHSSPVLSSDYLAAGIDEKVLDLLYDDSCFLNRASSHLSSRDWPISGGSSIMGVGSPANLMLLGHENGSLTLWTWFEHSVKLMHTIHTANHAKRHNNKHNLDDNNNNNNANKNNSNNDDNDIGDDDEGDGGGGDMGDGKLKKGVVDEDEDWPPFRKVGSFQPQVDDPHVAISLSSIHCKGHFLLACNNAGHVMMFEFFSKMERKRFCPVTEIVTAKLDMRTGADTWCDTSLSRRNIRCSGDVGYRLKMTIELTPPTSPTSLLYIEKHHLLAIGSACGYAVFDLHNNVPLITNKTLLSSAPYRVSSKARTLQRSFRESFRRLKRGTRHTRARAADTEVSFDSPTQTSHSRSPELSSTSQLLPQQHYRPTSTTTTATNATLDNNTHRRSRSNPEIANIITYNNNISNDSNASNHNNHNSVTDTLQLPATQQPATPTPQTSSRKCTPSKAFSPASLKHLTCKSSRRMGTLLKRVASRQAAEEPCATEVRCLHFARTHLIAGHQKVLTLWVGTSTGSVFIHQLDPTNRPTLYASGGEGRPQVDGRDVRCTEGGGVGATSQGGVRENTASNCAMSTPCGQTEKLTAPSYLAKEITFKHKCPIVYISVLDKTMRPIQHGHSLFSGPEATATCSDDGADEGCHFVLVVTQKQFKLFALPLLKPISKHNLDSDSFRLYKASVNSFHSKSDRNYVEHNIVCLSTNHQVLIFSLPHLTLQMALNNLLFDPRMMSCNVLSDCGSLLTFASPCQVDRHSLTPFHPLHNHFSINHRLQRPSISNVKANSSNENHGGGASGSNGREAAVSCGDDSRDHLHLKHHSHPTHSTSCSEPPHNNSCTLGNTANGTSNRKISTHTSQQSFHNSHPPSADTTGDGGHNNHRSIHGSPFNKHPSPHKNNINSDSYNKVIKTSATDLESNCKSDKSLATNGFTNVSKSGKEQHESGGSDDYDLKKLVMDVSAADDTEAHTLPLTTPPLLLTTTALPSTTPPSHNATTPPLLLTTPPLPLTTTPLLLTTPSHNATTPAHDTTTTPTTARNTRHQADDASLTSMSSNHLTPPGASEVLRHPTGHHRGTSGDRGANVVMAGVASNSERSSVVSANNNNSNNSNNINSNTSDANTDNTSGDMMRR